MEKIEPTVEVITDKFNELAFYLKYNHLYNTCPTLICKLGSHGNITNDSIEWI